MIWTETPTNPMLNIIDIESLGKISKTSTLPKKTRFYFNSNFVKLIF